MRKGVQAPKRRQGAAFFPGAFLIFWQKYTLLEGTTFKVHVYQWSTVLQGLNQTQPSLIQGKSPLNAPIVPLPSHRGATSKSTCQHIQGRGISVVTSATIRASKLMISRNTYCSILERIPLPAISAASLAGGQAD